LIKKFDAIFLPTLQKIYTDNKLHYLFCTDPMYMHTYIHTHTHMCVCVCVYNYGVLKPVDASGNQ